MRLRLSLLKDFVIRPLWVIAGLAIAILSNYDTLFPRWPWLRDAISVVIVVEPIGSIIHWFEANWGAVLLVLLCIAIFEGFYQKTSRFLGDQVEANIEITASSVSWEDDRLWVSVKNHEMANLTNCAGTIERLVYYEETHKVEISDGGPNLSWEGISSENGRITLEGGRKMTLNVIKHEDIRFYIMYNAQISKDSFSTPIRLGDGRFDIEIAIYGEMNGKQIKPIKKMFFVNLTKSEVKSRSGKYIPRMMMRDKSSVPEQELKLSPSEY